MKWGTKLFFILLLFFTILSVGATFYMAVILQDFEVVDVSEEDEITESEEDIIETQEENSHDNI